MRNGQIIFRNLVFETTTKSAEEASLVKILELLFFSETDQGCHAIVDRIFLFILGKEEKLRSALEQSQLSKNNGEQFPAHN